MKIKRIKRTLKDVWVEYQEGPYVWCMGVNDPRSYETYTKYYGKTYKVLGNTHPDRDVEDLVTGYYRMHPEIVLVSNAITVSHGGSPRKYDGFISVWVPVGTERETS